MFAFLRSLRSRLTRGRAGEVVMDLDTVREMRVIRAELAEARQILDRVDHGVATLIQTRQKPGPAQEEPPHDTP